MDLISCPNSSKDRYGNALSRTYAISQIAAGCRISSIRRYRDFRKFPKVEGWDRLGKVIQQGHRPKIRSRLSWRVHDVDAKPPLKALKDAIPGHWNTTCATCQSLLVSEGSFYDYLDHTHGVTWSSENATFAQRHWTCPKSVQLTKCMEICMFLSNIP